MAGETDPEEKAQKHITFLERTILDWYPKQPAWLRSFAFLVFLFLTAYGIFHSIGGQYIVRGRVLKAGEGGVKVAAKEVDIRLPSTSENFFGTNFDGTYYATLSPVEYFQLYITGSVSAVLTNGIRGQYQPLSVNFRRLDQTFGDVDFSSPSTPPVRTQFSRPKIDLFQTVLAYDGARGNRIAIAELNLSPKADGQEGMLKLNVNNRSLEALTVRGQSSAPALPLVPGQRFSYGLDYYFEIPGDLTGDLIGNASLQVKLNGFRQVFAAPYTESFPLRIPAKAVGPFTFSGSAGSWIKLIVFSPYSIALYHKEDLVEAKPALVKSLIDAGYWVNERVSPVGSSGETNALYFGKAVPYTTAQRLLALVSAAGIPVKWVEYGLPLKDASEVQIGSWTACQKKPPLDAAQLNKLASADSEGAFKREVASIPNCTLAAEQRPAPRSRR